MRAIPQQPKWQHNLEPESTSDLEQEQLSTQRQHDRQDLKRSFDQIIHVKISKKTLIVSALLLLIIPIIFYSVEIAYVQMRLNNQIGQKDIKIKDVQKQLILNGEQMNHLQVQLRQKLERIIQLLQSTTIKNASAANQQADQNPNTLKLAYQPNKQALPVNPLVRNAENKGIFDVLYKDEETRKRRVQFTEQRIRFVNANSRFQSANLIKYNLVKDEAMLREAVAENEKEWLRLEAKFRISSVKEELPMCIVSASFNNNANFRIEANLNSVFSQNYTNFKHVIINDASTDGSSEVYRNYFNFYKIDPQRYVYIENKNRVTALQNIYMAAINTCSKDSIVLIIDGDDEIIGRNTLKLFNWGFQARKVGVLYSNFYFYKQGKLFEKGPTQDYLQSQKKNNLYRNVPMKFSHLKAARAELFHQIQKNDLQFAGNFYSINADIALFYPLMELSCGRVSKLQDQFNLLYIWDTGINDYTKPAPSHGTFDQIRAKNKYNCSRQFDQKMKK